jgi:hypothetical protein
MRLPRSAATLDVFEIQRLKFTPFDLRNRCLKLAVLALPLLQKPESGADDFRRLAKQARGYLRIDELLLLGR